MTEIFNSIQQWQNFRNSLVTDGLGFVPTMGNLHRGHEYLLQRCGQENQHAVLTIFVNSTQFNEPQDFKNYPRSVEQDIALARKNNVDFVVLPTNEEMYPDNFRYQIHENEISTLLEGKARPGHFTGMLTIVMKLLLLIKPQRAYFGEKDYQQYLLVRDMVQAFFLETEIIPCQTQRNEAGLALSSRNNRLSKNELTLAAHFPQLLASNQPLSVIISQLQDLGFSVDYIEEKKQRRFGAVELGEIRLIDNIPLACEDT